MRRQVVPSSCGPSEDEIFQGSRTARFVLIGRCLSSFKPFHVRLSLWASYITSITTNQRGQRSYRPEERELALTQADTDLRGSRPPVTSELQTMFFLWITPEWHQNVLLSALSRSVIGCLSLWCQTVKDVLFSLMFLPFDTFWLPVMFLMLSQ